MVSNTVSSACSSDTLRCRRPSHTAPAAHTPELIPDAQLLTPHIFRIALATTAPPLALASLTRGQSDSQPATTNLGGRLPLLPDRSGSHGGHLRPDSGVRRTLLGDQRG